LPELAAVAAQLPDCILDGELSFLDASGKPRFSGLPAAMGKRKTADLVFFASDLLWRGADNLRSFRLEDRTAALKTLLEEADLEGVIRYVEPLPAMGGPGLMTAACRMGLEGIVSKRRDAQYTSGKSDLWVKSLCIRGRSRNVSKDGHQECGRHQAEEGARTAVGAAVDKTKDVACDKSGACK
jgi:bifunctional non-homologous end joining protein LigD